MLQATESKIVLQGIFSWMLREISFIYLKWLFKYIKAIKLAYQRWCNRYCLPSWRLCFWAREGALCGWTIPVEPAGCSCDYLWTPEIYTGIMAWGEVNGVFLRVVSSHSPYWKGGLGGIFAYRWRYLHVSSINKAFSEWGGSWLLFYGHKVGFGAWAYEYQAGSDRSTVPLLT